MFKVFNKFKFLSVKNNIILSSYMSLSPLSNNTIFTVYKINLNWSGISKCNICRFSGMTWKRFLIHCIVLFKDFEFGIWPATADGNWHNIINFLEIFLYFTKHFCISQSFKKINKCFFFNFFKFHIFINLNHKDILIIVYSFKKCL